MSGASPILEDIRNLFQAGYLTQLVLNALGLSSVSQLAGMTPGIVAIGADVTITAANKDTYNGKTLVWSGAFTVTLNAGLGAFAFIGETAASGNASIAFGAGVTAINGANGTTAAGTTITRASQAFAVTLRGTDLYRVSGF